MGLSQPDAVFLGLDFGTSGARAIAIRSDRTIVAQVQQPYAVADRLTESWAQTLWGLLAALPVAVRQHCQAVAIDGTSGTVLLCDRNGNPVTEPLLYNQAISGVSLPADATGPARSRTSSLSKALGWRHSLSPEQLDQVYGLSHQADWLAGLLHGQIGISDYHNALKLGYDVQRLQHPDWLRTSEISSWLPTVKPPGAVVGPLKSEVTQTFQLPQTCQVRTGTTDSIAAFLASGAHQLGEAVTSLGSSLSLKLLSQHPVEDAAAGVYSHRLGNLWLAGGSSNTGGAILRHYFTDQALAKLSAQIDPTQPTGLDYYPLLQPGERFPINDPSYPPRLTPRPDLPAQFLQGLLEGMARIEAQGYQKLVALGSSPVEQVYTAGGGAKNDVWTSLRSKALGIPVVASTHTEAAFGAALLATGQIIA